VNTAVFEFAYIKFSRADPVYGNYWALAFVCFSFFFLYTR